MNKIKHTLLGLAATFIVVLALSVTTMTTKADTQGNTIADISQYQGNINWAKAAPSLKYVIIRVQHGSKGYKDYTLDNKHNDSAYQADQHEIPYGEYSLHAFSSKKEAKAAAISFLRHSNKHARFYALDNEWQRGKMHKNQSAYVKVWRQTMRKYTKRPLIYYASESFAKGTNHSGFDGTWIANYSTAPKIQTDLWQMGQTKIPGFAGKVDTDVMIQNGVNTVPNWFSDYNLTLPTKKPKAQKKHKKAKKHHFHFKKSYKRYKVKHR